MAHHGEIYRHQNGDADRRTKGKAETVLSGRSIPKIRFSQRTGGFHMIGFIVGTFFGGVVGMTATCLCVVAGQADRMNCTNPDKKI